MARRNKRQKRRHDTVPSFQPSANPEFAHWMHQLRSSSAAQRHVPTPRKGTRRERERQAIRDQQRNQER